MDQNLLYLHGRGSDPGTPPGELVALAARDERLVAPVLTEDWLSRPFPSLVQQVDRWMDDSTATIGHSFGGWLLLCAAVARIERDRLPPPTCLLAPLLGRGFDARTGIGFFAPRARSVRIALGLEGDRTRGPEALRDRLRFVQAEQDPQSPIADAARLSALGYRVAVVPGGHHLDHPEARPPVLDFIRATTGRPRCRSLSP